ncbi:MAG: nicotinate-nucleotide adenylyltransferase [Thermoanaerobaculia bacterium]
MKIGLFGGSFDPIHEGHIEPVLAAQRELGLDRVVYLPTAAPPHKPERKFAPAVSRFAMAELALLDRADFVVSDHELTLGRPAYTIETLEHFRELAPGAEYFLLLGADSFLELETWRRWREIVTTTPLVVLARPGFSVDSLPDELAWEVALATSAGRIHVLRNPPLAVSSTELRRRLAASERIPDGWLAPRVVRYIEKYSFYR